MEVVCAYRFSGVPFSDLHFIESCLFCAECIINAILCLGDFNVDMLGQIDYNAKLLFDIVSLFSLRQLIDTPTRLTFNLETLILSFISSTINVVECGVSDMISVSNHLTIHTTLAIPRSHHPSHVSFLHNIHAIRPEDIEYELGLIDWSPLYAAPLMKWSLFIASLIEIFH